MAGPMKAVLASGNCTLEVLKPVSQLCERWGGGERGTRTLTPAGPSMWSSGPALLLAKDTAPHVDLTMTWVEGATPSMRASRTMDLATDIRAQKPSAGGAPHAACWLKGCPTTRITASARVLPDAARPCKIPSALGPAGEPLEAAEVAGCVRGERLVPSPSDAPFGRSRAGSESGAPQARRGRPACTHTQICNAARMGGGHT